VLEPSISKKETKKDSEGKAVKITGNIYLKPEFCPYKRDIYYGCDKCKYSQENANSWIKCTFSPSKKVIFENNI